MRERASGSRAPGRPKERARDLSPLWALALANVRYWPTVAPLCGRELARWRGPAQAIGDPALRTLASCKLEGEAFNAQVAATLATLAPAPRRAQSVRAILALELLFDYLDGRTEQLGERVLADGALLFEPFTSALALDGWRGGNGQERRAGGPADWSYLCALGRYTREHFRALPGAAAVSGVACSALARCAKAQTRIHAIDALGVDQLREWSQAAAESSGLDWREYAAGCASSVLAAHALIATAADPRASAADAERVDEAYLATGAAITILDSLVDAAEDREHGRRGFTSLYEPGELEAKLPCLVREALSRARAAPNGAHHAMTLAGVVAYYTSHPGAGHGEARAIARAVRAELSPTVWPALAVMGLWRAAKRARAMWQTPRTNAGGRTTATHNSGAGVE